MEDQVSMLNGMAAAPFRVYPLKKNLYQKALDFVLQVKGMYPDYMSENPHSLKGIPTSERTELQWLFEMSIHSLTILSRVYRVELARNTWESSKEDVVNALELMRGLLLPKEELNENTWQCYQQLRGCTHNYFTFHDLYPRMGLSERYCRHILVKLEEYYLIKRVGQNRKGACVYMFV